MKLQAFFSVLFLLLLQTANLWAQETAAPPVKMAEQFYGEGKIYIVIAVMTIIFAGLVFYLIRLERKIQKLEKEH